MAEQLLSFSDFRGFCNPKRYVNQIRCQNHKESQYEFSTNQLINNMLLANNDDTKEAYLGQRQASMMNCFRCKGLRHTSKVCGSKFHDSTLQNGITFLRLPLPVITFQCCEIYSKLTTKTPEWRRSGVFIVNF